MKTCSKCKILQPVDSFHKNGTYSSCKKCVAICNKNYRLNNIEKVRLQDNNRAKIRTKDPIYKAKQKIIARNWVENNREKHTERKLRWKSKNPLQVKAHTAVKDAVRAGKLIKLPCKKCGSNKQVEGHHKDYSKALKVTWLCRRCHVKLHMRLNKNDLHNSL